MVPGKEGAGSYSIRAKGLGRGKASPQAVEEAGRLGAVGLDEVDAGAAAVTAAVAAIAGLGPREGLGPAIIVTNRATGAASVGPSSVINSEVAAAVTAAR